MSANQSTASEAVKAACINIMDLYDGNFPVDDDNGQCAWIKPVEWNSILIDPKIGVALICRYHYDPATVTRGINVAMLLFDLKSTLRKMAEEHGDQARVNIVGIKQAKQAVGLLLDLLAYLESPA